MTLVFVYGTLKRGCSNHRILADQVFRGEARTRPGFRLFAIIDYPGMVRSESGQDFVDGEVWEVNDRCLAELDRLEGIAEGLYERVRIPLERPFHKENVQGYLFLHDVAGRQRIGSRWEEEANSSDKNSGS